MSYWTWSITSSRFQEIVSDDAVDSGFRGMFVKLAGAVSRDDLLCSKHSNFLKRRATDAYFSLQDMEISATELTTILNKIIAKRKYSCILNFRSRSRKESEELLDVFFCRNWHKDRRLQFGHVSYHGEPHGCILSAATAYVLLFRPKLPPTCVNVTYVLEPGITRIWVVSEL